MGVGVGAGAGVGSPGIVVWARRLGALPGVASGHAGPANTHEGKGLASLSWVAGMP